MRLLCCFVVATAFVFAGCETDLGECDMTAATKLVYTPDGTPYYEGQALVFQSCAGAFCHAAGATNANRFGVPHGLNFDVTPLTAASTPAELSILKHGIERIRDEAGELYDLVDSGEMPPGKAGERVLMPWKAADATTGMLGADYAIADVHGGAGKEVLRNWLACEAPIVAGTTGAPAEAAKYGDVVDGIETKINGTFEDVYAKVLSGTCRACHNGQQFLDVQALDFSTADKAFGSLVGKDSFASGVCKTKAKLVAAGDCKNSLLYQKVTGLDAAGAAVCGDRMPLASSPLSQAAIDAICQWVDAGATR